MSKNEAMDATMSRRAALAALGGVGAAVLLACAGREEASTGSSSGSGAGGSSGTASNGSSSGSSGSWASGGTASMTGDYASPFPLAAACLALTEVTDGPCTEAADHLRKDISEGVGGLPVRLALRVVDASCNPIANARVKIWHTQRTGSYSGDTPNDQMCLSSSAEGEKHYFRGVQTTDADGRVDFDTCFPGWYRGRAIHIHFLVALDGAADREGFVSQLGFPQALIQELFETHPDYVEFGQPDTPNASDNILHGDADYELITSKLPDGALMAAKEIRVG